MKFSNLVFAVILTAAMAGCGGGGGGGESGSVTPTPTPSNPTPTPTVITCPNGSVSTSVATCPAVTADVSALEGTTQSPTLFNQGLMLQFNGSLKPNETVVTWKQSGVGIEILVTTTITNNITSITVTPSIRLAYGAAQTITVTGTDALGRAVNVTLTFTTSAMTCTSNDVWSNPATFKDAYQACLAPIGVQTLMNTVINKMTDTSCAFTAGVALSPACKAAAANGTVMFAETAVVVLNNPTVWIAYFGADGSSNLVLLDAVTQKVVGTTVLPGPLAWIIGNPTGAAIALTVGGVTKRYQASWNGSAIALTCTVNC